MPLAIIMNNNTANLTRWLLQQDSDSCFYVCLTSILKLGKFNNVTLNALKQNNKEVSVYWTETFFVLEWLMVLWRNHRAIEFSCMFFRDSNYACLR